MFLIKNMMSAKNYRVFHRCEEHTLRMIWFHIPMLPSATQEWIYLDLLYMNVCVMSELDSGTNESQVHQINNDQKKNGFR